MLALGRRAGRADRPAPAVRELLAGRPGRPLRPLLGAVLRPGAGLRRRRRPARATTPSASSSSGTSSSCSTRCRGRLARRRCRTRTSTRALGLERLAALHPGRAVGVRERPVPAARGARRAPVGPQLRRRRPDHSGTACARRPRPRDDVPDRRRRRAVERGPRLHPAAHHAPRDPAGPLDRARAAVPRRIRRPRDRDHGTHLPRARVRARHDPPVARPPRRRASAARSSRARACSPNWSRAPRRRAPRGSMPRTRSSCTTPTASPTT